MSEHENPIGDVRFYALHEGPVLDRVDPLGLGRVRVRIPGFIEEGTGWAFPVGNPGGGTKARGTKFVPQEGAEVVVFFKGGNPDAPRYFPGHWGTDEAPDGGAPDPKKDPEDIHAMEFKKYAIVVDERAGKEGLTIRDKDSGDMIEFDGSRETGPGIQIKATAALVIEVDGLFQVDASAVLLNGRKLADGAQQF